MAFDKKKYPPYWRQFSLYIREERAQNKCEKCGAPNGDFIERGKFNGEPVWSNGHGKTFSAKTGEYLGTVRSYELDDYRLSKVVLTVAHLDNDGGVCKCRRFYGFKCAKPSHVLALCQSCHLSLDRPHHLAVQAKNRAIKKDAQRGLFQIQI